MLCRLDRRLPVILSMIYLGFWFLVCKTTSWFWSFETSRISIVNPAKVRIMPCNFFPQPTPSTPRFAIYPRIFLSILAFFFTAKIDWKLRIQKRFQNLDQPDPYFSNSNLFSQKMSTFLFSSESVNEGHPGKCLQRSASWITNATVCNSPCNFTINQTPHFARPPI